jgi:hypothetical protein
MVVYTFPRRKARREGGNEGPGLTRSGISGRGSFAGGGDARALRAAREPGGRRRACPCPRGEPAARWRFTRRGRIGPSRATHAGPGQLRRARRTKGRPSTWVAVRRRRRASRPLEGKRRPDSRPAPGSGPCRPTYRTIASRSGRLSGRPRPYGCLPGAAGITRRSRSALRRRATTATWPGTELRGGSTAGRGRPARPVGAGGEQAVDGRRGAAVVLGRAREMHHASDDEKRPSSARTTPR